MRAPSVAATLAVVLALVPAARANEASQALSARAAIAIDAGRTDEARALLDRAVEADPNDADVRYLRGVLRARAGDRRGAITDLEAALAQRPQFPTAALELGILLVDDDRAADAESLLMQAQAVPALDAQASFYLALAELRLERYEAARANLARARERDPSLAVASEYYTGVIAFRQGDYDAAEQTFAAVEQQRPDSVMGREAAQYAQVIEEIRQRDVSAFGTIAFEYDSNVTLGPTTTQAGISGQGDGRAVLNAGGRWTPLRWGGASLSLGYEFFQSLQFHLTSYNLTDNRPAVQLQYDIDWVSFGVLGRYDYYLLDGQSFLSEWTALPWVTIREEGFGRTEMYVRVQPRDFKATYNVLSGIYSFAGARQFIDLGNASRQLWLGYQLGFTSPEDSDNVDQQFNRDQYQYGSWAVEAGLRLPLPFEVLGQAVYRYEDQTYGPVSGCVPNSDSAPDPNCIPGTPLPAGLDRRRDHDHRVILSFERPLPEIWERLSVVAAYFGTFNDSNKTVFTYDRNIGSLALQVRY